MPRFRELVRSSTSSNSVEREVAITPLAARSSFGWDPNAAPVGTTEHRVLDRINLDRGRFWWQNDKVAQLRTRLAVGRVVRILMLGGSVTSGSGSMPKKSSMVQRGGFLGFPGLFADGLRHLWPAARFKLEVFAGSGLGSAYWSSACLESLVRLEDAGAVDLVVLDTGQAE